MGLIEYAAMARYWTQHPPVHLLAAAYFGYRAPEKPASHRSAEAEEMDFEAFYRMTQSYMP